MKIYTKTGDQGETALGDGKRCKKDDVRIQAYGDIDEFNALLGLCIATSANQTNKDVLLQVQVKLFAMGAVLSNPKLYDQPKSDKTRLHESDLTFLEQTIDTQEAGLKPLRSFILPGGSQAAALLHLARTVCRRVERSMVMLDQQKPLPPIYLAYINRLSDLLFVMARVENACQKIDDLPW